jgi:TPR repeat protein
MSNSTTLHTGSHSLQRHPAPPRQPATLPAAQQTNQETGSSGRPPPRLLSTTRAARHDVDDDDATPVLPERHADTLMALRGQLHALHDLEHDRAPEAVIAFFDALKAAEKDNILPEVIRQYRHANALHGFVNALTLFLGRLEGALRDPQSPLHLSLADLPAGQLRTICLGLAVCANPLAAMPFSATRRKEATTSQRDDASAALQGITDILLKLVDKAGLPDASKSVSVALDIMNWLTRGLKAGLLVASPAMTKMAPRFVEAFLAWSTPSVPALSADAAVTLGGPPAKAAPPLHREPHQIGKCAAQVNPILQFTLLGPEPAAVGMLRKLAFNLGSHAFLKSLQTPPMQGVALINLTNMVKDGITAGLLPLSDQRLPAMVEGLLDLIIKMPASEIVVNGGTALGNVGNFLRELIELELQEPAPFCVSTLRDALEACKKVVDCTQEATSLGSQSTVNLLSYMKAADKWLAKTGAAKGGPAQANPASAGPASAGPAQAGSLDIVAAEALKPALLAAAKRLIDRVCQLDADSFSSRESLGGLMAALGYFAERHVAMPARAIDLVRALAASIAEVETTHWERQSRGALLQAIEILVEQRLIPLKQSQGALRSLLGPCSNPGGFYTKHDLSAAASRLGPRREAVPVLVAELVPEFVPEPQAKPEPEPESEPANPVAASPPATPAALPLRPGFTAIVEQQKAKAEPAKKKAKSRNRKAAGAASASTSSSPATPASATPSGSASPTAAPSAPRNEFTPASRIARSRFADASSALVVTAPEVVSRTQNATAQAKEKKPAAAKGKPVPAEQKTGAPLPPSTTVAPGKQPPSAQTKKGAAANPPHQPEPGAPATTGSMEKPGTTKQPPAGIAPQTKWFDQVARGAASLPKLQQFAEANPELLNATDKTGRNALFYAITRGKSAVVTWLMAQPERKEIPRRFVDTLLAAIAPATPETVQALVAFVTLAITRQDFSNTELEQILTRRLGKQPWLKAVLEAVAAKAESATLPAAGKAEVRASPAQAESAQASAASANQASDALQGMTIKELEHRATAQRDPIAQAELGRRYRTGDGVPKDDRKAAEWYGMAAAQGHAGAQYCLGLLHANGDGVRKDQRTASALFAKAAAQGHVKAQFALGVQYATGDGVKQDEKKAAKWYCDAAAQGHAEAKYDLALLYASGKGVPRDRSKAIALFGESAALGHADAQFALGSLYQTGVEVKKDVKKAVEWYVKAAEQGHVDAQSNLGVMYAHGNGVPKDETLAVEWFAKAAAQGHPEAQCNLGTLYGNGSGVPKNKRKAVELFGLAAAQGNIQAQKNLEILTKRAGDLPTD